MTENTTTTTYNGWQTQATWRVNLELCDDILEGLDADQLRDIVNPDYPTVSLADYLQESCEEIVCDFGDADTLAKQYAVAYLSQVSWFEIAEHFLRDNPELLGTGEEESDEE